MSTTPTSSTSSSATEKASDKPIARNGAAPVNTIGWWLRVVLVGVTMAGVGYMVGRVQGALATSEVEEREAAAATEHQEALAAAASEHEEALSSVRAEVTAAEERVSALQTLAATYEAHRIAIHALEALDARNFGIAEAQVREAERALAPLVDRVEGLDELVAELHGIEIEVAADLEGQRTRLAAVVRRLDSVVTAVRASVAPATPEP